MARSDSRAPRAAPEEEKAFQQHVTTLATWCGWWVFHPYDSRRSMPGWPDLVLLRPPSALFVELKTERGRVTEEQAAVLRALGACGLDARVWRPTDWQEIEETLARRRP